MKKLFHIALAIIIALSACTKVEKTRTSGTDTIDNVVHTSNTYFVYGFSFSEAKLMSNLGNPHSDINLILNSDNVAYRLTFQADNLSPSFYKVGDFADAAAAITAFNNLNTVSVPQWTEIADPVNANQVWIYRSGTENYTKIRIVSIVNEIRQLVPYAECTFQWVYQPDGSLTFPAK